ncbi:putative outer membrane repeat protein [Micromonospora pisi]|uniref:Putative outer membrane repeat protein n=1 Tax=Micromonospora pisi TaxID=589240 RepID=A0A495JU20_9ACTN|nr:putative outer membrane repeat protein [Micromonospora pisi]
MMSNQLPEHQDAPRGAQDDRSVPSGKARRVRRYVTGAVSLAGVASLAAVAGMSGAPAVASATDALGLPRLFMSTDGGYDDGGYDNGGQDPGGWRPEWDKDAKQVGCDSNELISALVEANTGRGAKLKLTKGCTYSLTVYQGPDGLPVITQPVAIKGEGAKIERAANADPFRIFNVGTGGELTLHDLTVAGGDDRSGDGGGGLLVQAGGKAVLEKSAVVANRSTSSGGGIANYGITALLSGEEKDQKHGDDQKHGEDPEQSKDGESPAAEAEGAAVDGATVEPADGADASDATGGSESGPNDWTDGGWSKDGWDHDKSEYVTKVSGNSAQGAGGGIYSGGLLVVDGAEVSRNNSARDGGGISNTGGTASVTRSKVSNNVSVGLGGGIHAGFGAVTKIVYSGVIGNESTGPSAAGGGIQNYDSSLYIRHSEVVRNNAGGLAGGIYNGGGRAVVEQTKVSENTAQSNGGGLYNVDGTMVVRKSLVDSNRTVGVNSVGGGIFTVDGSLALTESRVARNDAVNPPGGIFADGTLVTVDERTVIVNNRPTNCVGSGDPVPNCFG